ncbi:hypothetical protein M9458_034851, partial [Cirrhinus mrigala]
MVIKKLQPLKSFPVVVEHLEQDVLQPQDVNTPVGSTEDDTEEQGKEFIDKFTAIIQNITHISLHFQLLRIAFFDVATKP